jgi:hypothetical protein
MNNILMLGEGSYYSVSLLIKFTFVIILLLLTIYLFYMENKLIIARNEESKKSIDITVMQASSSTTRTLRNLFLLYLPAMVTNYSASKSRVDGQLSNKEKRELENFIEDHEILKAKINKLEEISAVDKAKYSSLANQISDYCKQVVNFSDKKSELTSNPLACCSVRNRVKNNTELESKISSGLKLSAEDLNLVSNKASIQSDIMFYDRQLKDTTKKLDQASEEISKSSIFNLDFDFNKFVESLTTEEKLAFCGLVFNHLILTYTISIIVILYGDYLIERFDLVNKYPKIAKFIHLRRKFQQYYLKISFIWIFLCVLPQMCMYILILLPKITQLFS